MPPPDFSKLTDADLQAELMREMLAWRAAEMQVLADPSSTPQRRAQAQGDLLLLAEVLA